MTCTEEEARGKVCCGPPALSVAFLMASRSRPLEVDIRLQDRSGMCLGSRCMAWQKSWTPERKFKGVMSFSDWSKLLYVQQEKFVEPPRAANVPSSWQWEGGDFETVAGWREPQEEADKQQTGYCGLAGSP